MADFCYVCNVCGRAFGTPNGLRVHKLSKVHEGMNVYCDSCPRAFRTPGYLFMHLETGLCGDLTLVEILKSVKAWEAGTGRHRLFTFKRRRNRILSNAQDNDDHHIRYLALNSFDGELYRCPLCDRPFKNHIGLEQHLSSIAHEKAYCYGCKACNMEFRLLSSLFQHLESDSCPWMTFGEVKRLASSLQRYL